MRLLPPSVRVPKPKLHLDADASSKALERALRDRGHDVTRTPQPWAPLDASDEVQLLAAAARNRAILSYNVRDFPDLGSRIHAHAGILLAAQRKWTLSQLVATLDQILRRRSAEDLRGQIVWLPKQPLP